MPRHGQGAARIPLQPRPPRIADDHSTFGSQVHVCIRMSSACEADLEPKVSLEVENIAHLIYIHLVRPVAIITPGLLNRSRDNPRTTLFTSRQLIRYLGKRQLDLGTVCSQDSCQGDDSFGFESRPHLQPETPDQSRPRYPSPHTWVKVQSMPRHLAVLVYAKV